MAQSRAPSMSCPLALTMGEPAGIGGELTLKAWAALNRSAQPFLAIDDIDRLATISEALDLGIPLRAVDSVSDAASVFAEALPVLHRPLGTQSIPGRLMVGTAEATIGSIETAVTLTRQGDLSGVVTNPIHKKNLLDAGFGFPGHTEFLAHLCGAHRSVMMLAAPELRVVPVTVHRGLKQALTDLNADVIIQTGKITADALRFDFGIAEPRLAVAGLNPHAGEGGAMGDEELTMISPAVAALRDLGINAFGPLPPDTLFHEQARAGYDAVLCMYHDQALIPIKAIAFDRAVNVTLGLDIVRTSPDHGTALDLAGTGKASAASLIAAIHLAGQIAQHRRSCCS